MCVVLHVSLEKNSITYIRGEFGDKDKQQALNKICCVHVQDLIMLSNGKIDTLKHFFSCTSSFSFFDSPFRCERALKCEKSIQRVGEVKYENMFVGLIK